MLEFVHLAVNRSPRDARRGHRVERVGSPSARRPSPETIGTGNGRQTFEKPVLSGEPHLSVLRPCYARPHSREHLAHSVGPRFTSVLSYFAGCHGVSKRGVEEIATVVFDVPVALGTVANLEQEMSAALAVPHQEAVAAVRAAEVKHADETSWKLRGKLCWCGPRPPRRWWPS